ncbi:adenylate/guanylate cyclase domain-containing response regulator [Entomospira culicis]|uniref:Adenylate/guanylate cyclase domain-containing protein n=1 Tax=Entomospira culicis TaxID=2719989 RepID=A0A968GHX2_9SPIO|nr:adenylate/guanylate cyclase domain-containing response regulator [Entomospira culicis]NIZ18725.1 adenylate/guanylate cyclase domain-containing protein [Entomospira culicis]NIZ68940.1 adenylate/guanylate cyclase domain-containing protein [Entomospira culicis]WDI37532.1 adenylate/guanylate cyclase domain-containing response regulator [Entomospira culicis]WDI39160.1 adenylate/guanylate cyclase domain-containing response regulator [Entomospira culicis]
MHGIILIIDQYDYSKHIRDLLSLGKHEGFDEFIVAYAKSIDEAYNIFFEHLPVLIIANAHLEGGPENLQMLKEEEMYRHIPVILVTKEYNRHYFKRLYEAGADAVLTYQEVDLGHLQVRARPLISQSALFQLKILHSSELQEKALLDFILLDIIKQYVPRTIWEIANKCAEEQTMQINEQSLELTCAFGDVKGFTTISQTMTPSEVISFLNVAYEIVTRNVYAHNGDIDKFIGDAFFAVFTNSKDAIKAIRNMQLELVEASRQREANNEVPVMFRISVHTGSVIRGNVGGNKRYDNTLIGDTVNTASRLEHEAPVGGIMVSQSAAAQANLNVPIEEMTAFNLRGRDSVTYAFSYFDMVEKGFINEEEFLRE